MTTLARIQAVGDGRDISDPENQASIRRYAETSRGKPGESILANAYVDAWDNHVYAGEILTSVEKAERAPIGTTGLTGVSRTPYLVAATLHDYGWTVAGWNGTVPIDQLLPMTVAYVPPTR